MAALIDNESDMEAFGAKLAQQIGFGSIVYLEGDLGAGKTTICRGFLRASGYDGAVRSPTYTLVEPYEFPDGTVFHFDLYRIEDAAELEMLGIRDMIGEHSICLLEWPDKGAGVIPAADWRIKIDIQDNGRYIELIAPEK